jgi:hypothetical protein
MQNKYTLAGSAAGTILSIVLPFIIKDPPLWITGTCAAFAVCLFVYFLFGAWDALAPSIWLPMMKLHPYQENVFPYRRALKIKDAAQIAYDKTQGTGLAEFAKNWAEKQVGDELSSYADYFKDLGDYTLYGKLPNSNRYQVIPPSHGKFLWFTQNLDGLKPLGPNEKLQYIDIAVTRADLRKLIKYAQTVDVEVARANLGKKKPGPSTISDHVPSEIKRDTKVKVALGYVETGKWNTTFGIVAGTPGGRKDKGFSPSLVRQAALDGDIQVWGKRSQTGPYIPIPAKYWKHWQIDWYSAMGPECQTDEAEHGADGFIYYDHMVSKTEIEKKWPPHVE